MANEKTKIIEDMGKVLTRARTAGLSDDEVFKLAQESQAADTYIRTLAGEHPLESADADRPSGQHFASILNTLMDIEKELGELSLAMAAQQMSMGDLVPNFEALYKEHLGSAQCLKLRREYEYRIRVLLEASRKMAES
ncbi:MAG: hypothetical protein WAN24_07335 [Candidatus Acidiferrales bacterium]|jgi:hypothetical protein